jgi:hypothetical protein
LTLAEKGGVDELRSKARIALSGEAIEAREKYIAEKAKELSERTGKSPLVARETIRKQWNGDLLPSFVLPFDDPELAGKTVADVLANPSEFEGETLADPLEGAEHGRCKARIMRRADGTLWIHSFAHGRTTYELKLDADAIRAAMAKVPAGEVVMVLVDMLLRAAVSPAEEEALTSYAKELSGSGTRAISRQIKLAREDKAAKDTEEARERHMAEREDPRPCLPAPAHDAPWLPEMAAYDDVLGKSTDRVPPARNISGSKRPWRVASRSQIFTPFHPPTRRTSGDTPASSRTMGRSHHERYGSCRDDRTAYRLCRQEPSLCSFTYAVRPTIHEARYRRAPDYRDGIDAANRSGGRRNPRHG